MPDQLSRLAKPFPPTLVKEVDAGHGRKAAYVSHASVTEKLLAVVGPFSLSVEELIRDAGSGAVVGCIVSLSAVIGGREVTVSEVGAVDEIIARDSGEDVTGNDGERAKLAVSDGLKRCAMRLGVGLHLWSGPSFRLDRALASNDSE
jgi:hypothetical protein